MSERIERLAKLMERFLSPLSQKLGFSIDTIESVEVDPEGPRIVVQAGGGEDYERLYVDISPDGVELTVTIPAPKGLDPDEVDAILGLRIEEGEEFEGIEEYDVAYDPEEGELTVTLHARTVNGLPNVQTIRRVAGEVLEELRSNQESG
ncbi:hypothetical protein [Pyrolobus fumarii]|nr:hypothetical protein [Pyrolobus fumarii]